MAPKGPKSVSRHLTHSWYVTLSASKTGGAVAPRNRARSGRTFFYLKALKTLRVVGHGASCGKQEMELKNHENCQKWGFFGPQTARIRQQCSQRTSNCSSWPEESNETPCMGLQRPDVEKSLIERSDNPHICPSHFILPWMRP